MSFFPRRRDAAVRAKAQDVPEDGVNVVFDVALLDVLAHMAEAAFERDAVAGRFERLRRREFHRPEMRIWIDEREAIHVATGFAADLADEADHRLFRGIGQPKRQDFVRGKPVSRQNSCAVAAEHHCFRFFRKHFACRIRAEQNDSEFFHNASAAAFRVHK